jgi:hypothetical protein
VNRSIAGTVVAARSIGEPVTAADIADQISADGAIQMQPAGGCSRFVHYFGREKARRTLDRLAAMLQPENGDIQQADAERSSYRTSMNGESSLSL